MKPNIKGICLVLLFSLLTACMGLGGLKQSQIKVLQKEGFIYTTEGWTLDLPSRILFTTDAHLLEASQQEMIIALSNKLQKINIQQLIVQGHTDDIGADAYNQKLSEQRAQSVSKVLLQNGFLAEYIQTIGFGAAKPIKSNETEEGRSENRRVSIIIIP